MSVLCLQIKTDFPHLFTETLGSLQVPVLRVSSLEQASPETLVFAATEGQLSAALERHAGAIVVAAKLEVHLPENSDTTLLVTPRLTLALAQIVKNYFDPSRFKFAQEPPIDPRAFIASSAYIAPDACVAAGAFVGPDVEIGTNAFIGPGCVIERGARIGADTLLHAQVFVGWGCQVGARCEIHPHTTLGSDGYRYAHNEQGNHYKIPQVGIVVVEDDVEIGANCAIDRAAFDTTRIGCGTKLDNLCHIAHICHSSHGSQTERAEIASEPALDGHLPEVGGTELPGLSLSDQVELQQVAEVSLGYALDGQESLPTYAGMLGNELQQGHAARGDGFGHGVSRVVGASARRALSRDWMRVSRDWRKVERSLGVKAEGPPPCSPMSRRKALNSRAASASPMESGENTRPLGSSARAPLASTRAARGMSEVMVISQGVASSTIQSSAASKRPLTTFISIRGLRGTFRRLLATT